MKSLVLGNGLRIVMSPSPTDVVYCGIAIDAGTRDELGKESGLAHFTEHLSFKGTERHSSRQIINHMECVGGELNAFTGKEETVYYCTCQKSHFRRAIDILFDIVLHSTYPQNEIGKEVEVVIDEIESYQDSPSELIYDDFESILFQGHPLGRNILGEADKLRTYGSSDVKAFTQRLYVPERMVLFVYGNIDEKTVLKSIPLIEASPGQSRRISQALPEYHGPQIVSMHKDTHQAHVMMGARALAANHDLHLPLFLANNIMGGPGLSSRLNLALRERTGLVYTVESLLTSYTDTGVWSVYFGCDKKDVKRCRNLVERELNRICEKPLSKSSLNAAKRQLTGQLTLGYDNFENVAIGMGKRMLHYNKMQDMHKLVEHINAITADEVHQAVQLVFNPEQLTVLEYL